MLLGDKILELRKKSGMSQEELADKLNVSRQSISKWEGSQSIPDINRILEMIKLFGVSTDYLLKEDMQSIEYSDDDPQNKCFKVSLDIAKDFISAKAKQARSTAIGVALLILSPVLLILLSGAADTGYWPITESVAAGVGLTTLLVMVAVSVAIFIISGNKMQRFEQLSKSDLELEYGVSGIIKQQRSAIRPRYNTGIVAGVTLCILAAIPLILVGVFDCGDMAAIACTCLLLVLVAIAVFIFIIGDGAMSAINRLLQEEEYSPEAREEEKKTGHIGGIYWPIVAAAYLGWSLITGDWHITWIIWLIAGILYGAVCAIVSMTKKG